MNKYLEADAKEYGFYSEELMDYMSNGGALSQVPDSFNVPTWVKQVYVTAPEISPKAHVLMQAAFQMSTDSGISKTINFANSATVKDVEEAYLLAWRSKCKGITVYRAGSREKEVLVKGNAEDTHLVEIVNQYDDGVQLELAFPLVDEITSEINYVEAPVNLNGSSDEICCDNPYIVMESGCESCKSCGWSACLIA